MTAGRKAQEGGRGWHAQPCLGPNLPSWPGTEEPGSSEASRSEPGVGVDGRGRAWPRLQARLAAALPHFRAALLPFPHCLGRAVSIPSHFTGEETETQERAEPTAAPQRHTQRRNPRVKDVLYNGCISERKKPKRSGVAFCVGLPPSLPSFTTGLALGPP